MPKAREVTQSPNQGDEKGEINGKRVAIYLLVSTATVCGVLVWAAQYFALQTINSTTFVASIFALLASALSVFVTAWRTRILSQGRVDLLTGVKVTSVVATIMILFPSRVSDFVKPVYLQHRIKLPIADGLSILFLERMFDVFVVAALISVCGLLTTTTYFNQFSSFGALMGAASLALAGAIFAICYFPNHTEALITRLPFSSLRSFALRLLQGLRSVGNINTIFWGTTSSLVVWFTSYLIFATYLMTLGYSQDIAILDPLAVLLVFMAGTIGLVVTVTPGGVGTFEFAIAFALTFFDIPLSVGLFHALLLRIIIVMPNLIVTILILVFDNLTFQHLKLLVSTDDKKVDNENVR